MLAIFMYNLYYCAALTNITCDISQSCLLTQDKPFADENLQNLKKKSMFNLIFSRKVDSTLLVTPLNDVKILDCQVL